MKTRDREELPGRTIEMKWHDTGWKKKLSSRLAWCIARFRRRHRNTKESSVKVKMHYNWSTHIIIGLLAVHSPAVTLCCWLSCRSLVQPPCKRIVQKQGYFSLPSSWKHTQQWLINITFVIQILPCSHASQYEQDNVEFQLGTCSKTAHHLLNFRMPS